MGLLKFVQKLNNILEKVSNGVLAVIMAGLVLVIFAQVLGRYIFKVAPPWFEESGRFFLIWLSFLASAVLYRHRGHVGVSFLRDMFSFRIRRILVFVSDIAMLVFCGLLTYYGIKLCMLYTTRFAETMYISMSVIYSIFAISFGLMFLFTIENIIKIIVDPENVPQLRRKEES